MEDRKLLFFDIDGTLLSEKTHTVPQSAKEALKKAKENGKMTYGELAKELENTNPEQIDKVFDAFEKVPGALWEEEYEKYNEVLSKYKDIKMLRWAESH